MREKPPVFRIKPIVFAVHHAVIEMEQRARWANMQREEYERKQKMVKVFEGGDECAPVSSA